MDPQTLSLPLLWDKLIWPLCRLIGFVSIGLLVANIIESFQWTKRVAFLAKPLIKHGNMSATAGASFTMAFFSGVSANTMLAEAYSKQELSKKELVLANLFNSLPTYFLHLPTVFFITLGLIQEAAIIYIGLTLGAALLRSCSIVLLGHFILPKQSQQEQMPTASAKEPKDKKELWIKIFKRFKRRMKKIIKFTVPIYILIFFLHRVGFFQEIEQSAVSYLTIFPWLTPQSLGIITLHIAAELTAGLAAAGALLQEGTMSVREIVIALMIGNIISSPVRAIRHQFPYYAGIFEPKLASELIIYNQTFRVGSLMLVGTLYIIFGG